MFRRNVEPTENSTNRLIEFSYLGKDAIYLDSSCQTLRPQPVIDSISAYYHNYGACGGRVKYAWGKKVDSLVEQTRDLVIDYLELSKKDYVCSFTLNTTYGLNLILSQLPKGYFERIITSEIEHNSVFLPTMTNAKRLGLERVLLSRDGDGSLIYDKSNLKKAIVVVNTNSNIDGRPLKNIKQLIKDTRDSGGITILDAAQTVAHHKELLAGCNSDAVCFSAHKTYAGSLGVMVIRKDLLKIMDIKTIGGGMVSQVKENDYTMWPDDMSSWLEPGLQPYAEIISLKHAIEWLQKVKPNGQKPYDYIAKMSKLLFNGLSEIPGIVIVNTEPSSVISLYSKKVDSHRLAAFLSASGIMTRSGYFCCHYYLHEKLKLPPLLRFSVGLHSNDNDIKKTIEVMKRITKA